MKIIQADNSEYFFWISSDVKDLVAINCWMLEYINFVVLKVHVCSKKAFTCSRMIWWCQIKLSLFSAIALILDRWMTFGLKKNSHLISYLEHSLMCSLNHFVSISFWQILLKVNDGTRNTNSFQWLSSFLGILLIFSK